MQDIPAFTQFDLKVTQAMDKYTEEGSDDNFMALLNVLFDQVSPDKKEEVDNLRLVLSSNGKEGNLLKAAVTMISLNKFVPESITPTVGYNVVYNTIGIIIAGYAEDIEVQEI